MNHLVTAGRRRSVQCSELRGHFFTAKELVFRNRSHVNILAISSDPVGGR